MRVVDVVRALEPWRARHRRAAWHPVLRAATGDLGPSRFGGLPDLADGEPWPGCEICRKPLTPVVQLDLAGLPSEAHISPGRGLLQLFYCDRGCLYDWERNGRLGPANRAGLARILESPGPTTRTPPPDVRLLPTSAIVGWERVEDTPDGYDHEQLGLVTDYYWDQKSLRLTWLEGGLTFDWVESMDVAEEVSSAQFGHKLRGWPAWCRVPARPDCPQCGRPMAFVFQVECGGGGAEPFIALGRFYVWQCADHPAALAFSHDK